jgi:hypothetical protein
MKIHLSVLLLAVSVTTCPLLSEESQKPQLEPLLQNPPAASAPAAPESSKPVAAVAAPAPTPESAAVASPAGPVKPALPVPASTPAATAPGGIPFNAENKQTAKKIYGVINEIQRTGFDPQKNFALIAELQRVIAGTRFCGLREIDAYIRASLNLNSLRSRDSKAEQGNTGSQESVSQKSRGLKLEASMIAGPIVGGDLGSAENSKVVGGHTSGVTISSQANYAELGPAMQQQSAAYGKLLDELNSVGFPEPILPSQLIGKWKWHSSEVAATYEFDLQEDGSLNAEVIADDPVPTPAGAQSHPAANKGRGEWKLDYRSLTLELHGAKLALFWRQSPQTFLAGKLIKSIDGEEIILDAPQDNLLIKVRKKGGR